LPRDRQCGSNIAILGAFGAAAEKNDEGRALPNEIHPVSWSIVDAQLGDPTPNGPHVSGVSQGQAAQAYIDASSRSTVSELSEPDLISLGLPNLDHI